MTDNSSNQLQVEQLRQLCRLLPLSVGTSVLLALIVVSVLWHSTGHIVMLSWFAALCGCSAWRLGFLHRHRRLQLAGLDLSQPEHIARVRRFGSSFVFSSLISGAIWGSSALLLYPPGNMVLQLFLVFVLAGVTSGSASSFAANTRAALAFQLPVLLPLAARLLLQPDAAHAGMGLMVLIYAAFIVASVYWVNSHITENIILRLQAVRREQALHDSEARYRELAFHDALTGLPNRHALQPALSLRLTQAQGAGLRLALTYFDIDNFKDINDSRGHGCGDALLVEVAQRLRRYASPEDIVARIGGDEFIVVHVGAPDLAAVTAFVSQLSTRLTESWLFEGEPIRVSASVGVSIYPDHGDDPEVLIKHADIALYRAKALGRNNYQFFAPDMRDDLQGRILLERALAAAISSKKLSVAYQPVVELRTGRILGLEALARWHDSDRGQVSPEIFIPLAEQSGLIDALGEQVLRLVCTQLRDWRTTAVPLVPISLNVSPRQFDQGRLHELIAAVSAELEVDPKLFQIEITESALLRGARHHRTTLEALRALGVKVYFGTGYSSLNYLKHMPIDGLKIDRAFVHEMANDPRDAAIVGAIISIGLSLGIRVVAEGVESTQQAEQLLALGCGAAQGYYFHRPMPAARCCEFLREFGPHRAWTDTLRNRMLQWMGA